MAWGNVIDAHLKCSAFNFTGVQIASYQFATA